jgi:hypothetical protein
MGKSQSKRMKNINMFIFLIFLVSCKDNDKYLSKELYRSIQLFDVDRVNEIMKQGGDPNYCKGEAGWVDSNPLIVLSWYSTINYFNIKRENPNPTPEIEILNILINSGANINKRPYIWALVYQANNDNLDQITRFIKSNNKYLDENGIKEKQVHFVTDVNRLLKGYLDAGADPDKLGHPYPFSNKISTIFLTDNRADKYFKNGTRALNIAIEKGIMWENQVDLLLQYTNLDEESLKAAERSNDHAMIEKINKLLDQQ